MDETLMKLRGRTFAAQFNRTGNIHGCSLAHGKQTVGNATFVSDARHNPNKFGFCARLTKRCHERCSAPHTCWNFLPKPIDMKKKTEKNALLAPMLTLPSALHADDILGRVADASTGEALPGATVVI